MAQLHSIIGSILRDIIAAQHEANLYSCSLSESYGKEGKTRDFQLPGVIISDMELELKYGVNSSEENRDHFNLKLGKTRAFIREICHGCAKIALLSSVATVLDKDTTRPIEQKSFFVNVRNNSDVNRQFLTFLSRNMSNAFNGSIKDIVNQDTGELLTDKVCEKIMTTLKKKFYYDTDLDGLFEGSDGEALRNRLITEVTTLIQAKITFDAQDENFKSKRSFPQLDVAITSDELMKLPEEAIHSFKLKFSPTACTITTLDDENWLEDFEMKTQTI
ncbi:MAG: hypothetical protein KBT33_13480 [Prevotellaceae bacterium]|nr:hypothetical protein [Candidatus Minthosoma equi]